MVGARPAAPHEYDSLIRFGNCTAVLIRSDTLLTSGHCVVRRPPYVEIAGQQYAIGHCETDPQHVGEEAAHDIGFCTLTRSLDPAITSTTNLMPMHVGESVAIVGFGQTGPFTHEPALLRVAETKVTTVAANQFDAGTADVTACWGDSGGGVFNIGAKGAPLVGIVHGPSGAICASPTQVARLTDSEHWLRERGVLANELWAPRVEAIVSLGILVGGGLLFLRWRRSQRSSR